MEHLVIYFIVSFLLSLAWLAGIGTLLYVSLTESKSRSTHQSGSILVFFSAFGRAMQIPTIIGNSALEIRIARISLVILALFIVSFFLCIRAVIQHHG